MQYNSKLSELTIVESLCVDGVKVNMIDYVKQDYTLHDCMEPWLFKFAD